MILPKPLQRLCDYALYRANETSTWRSLSIGLGAFFSYVDPHRLALYITLGMGIAGLLGVALPDCLARGKALVDRAPSPPPAPPAP